MQLNPIRIAEVPKTARAIIDHAATLSFNSSLMREMRAIKFVSDLIDRGELDRTKHMRVFIHTIDAEIELAAFDVSSKFNSDLGFLQHLFALGRSKADRSLRAISMISGCGHPPTSSRNSCNRCTKASERQ